MSQFLIMLLYLYKYLLVGSISPENPNEPTDALWFDVAVCEGEQQGWECRFTVSRIKNLTLRSDNSLFRIDYLFPNSVALPSK